MMTSKPRTAAQIVGIRLPELCGIAWLVLLAVAIWTHSHASKQVPIYDASSYYEKANVFWTAVGGGKWFNPLNLQQPFRPPGTVLMTYPFGFSTDPRGFYFRSVYFPAVLLFSAVMIVDYNVKDDSRARWWTVLTAAFFTTMTFSYHFDYGSRGGYWGLVDGFLAGLASVAAASAWRGTRLAANIPGWAILTSLISVLSIIVKPSGALVAAVAGLAWVVFSLATLMDNRQSNERLALLLKLIFGAVFIGASDLAIMVASVSSSYLSKQNMAYGQNAIALMRQIKLPPGALWGSINDGLGVGFLLWAFLVVAMCVTATISSGRFVISLRHLAGILVAFAVLLFGIWFWFVGSGSATQIRYALPFFMMTLIWLMPVGQQVKEIVPALLKMATPLLMIVVGINLALVLLLPQPSLAWQKFSGVGVTSDFPPTILDAFKRLATSPSDRSRSIYLVSFDINDAIFDSLIDYARDLGPTNIGLWTVRRPVDWQRSATIRLNEVEASNALMVNPTECPAAHTSPAGTDLGAEQGVFTCWADTLTIADGATVFFAAPTVKILLIADPAEFRASLDKMVAAHVWDSAFVLANSPLPRAP
jgi:hypothetical protein